jgi:hypothetical protein
MTLLEVGGLAAVGEADPNAQVVVGELASRIDPVAEDVEGAEVALLARDHLTQAQMQGAAEPGRVGPDAGQPDRPLGGAGQDQLDRDDPGDHVGGGSIQAGRRYSISGSGSSGGSDVDTTRC